MAGAPALTNSGTFAAGPPALRQVFNVLQQRLSLARRVRGKLFESVQYRPVARTSADVPVNDLFYLQLGRLRVFLQETEIDDGYSLL